MVNLSRQTPSAMVRRRFGRATVGVVAVVVSALLAHGCLIAAAVPDAGADTGVDAGGPYALFGGQFVTATAVPFEQWVVTALANAQTAMTQSRWGDVDAALAVGSPLSTLLAQLDTTFVPMGSTTITASVRETVVAARAGDSHAVERWQAWAETALSLAVASESMLAVSDTVNGAAHWDRAAMYASALGPTFDQLAASRPVGLFCPAACPLAHDDVRSQLVAMLIVGRGAAQANALGFVAEDAERLGLAAVRVLFLRAMERAARAPVLDVDRDVGAVFATGVADALSAFAPGAQTASAVQIWLGPSASVHVGPVLRGFGGAFASAETVLIGQVGHGMVSVEGGRSDLTFNVASGGARGAVDAVAEALTVPGHDAPAMRNEVLAAQTLNAAGQQAAGVAALMDVTNAIAQVGSP